MWNQECEYPRESDWYPRMIKPLLFLHQVYPRNDRKSDNEDFTQKKDEVADAVNRRYS